MGILRFLLFLSLLSPFVSALGIGVSPSSLEFSDSTEHEILIFNTGEFPIELDYHPNDFVDIDIGSKVIQPYGMTKAKVHLRKVPKQETALRLFAVQGVDKGLIIGAEVPIIVKPKESYSVVEIKQKKEVGVLVITSIMFMGVALYLSLYSFFRKKRV